jgi:arylsulfatase A-like enzyme
MHVHTHLKPSSVGKTDAGLQGDGTVEYDGMVGELLQLLDELKIADNTLVLYSTDNGAMKGHWPDGGASPFRSEKDTNWEGAYWVPALIRWPIKVKPGTNFTGLFSEEDWLPTLDSAAGYENWASDHAFLVLPAVQKVAAYLQSYREFPPRQRPASFSIDQVVEKLESSLNSSR